MENFSTSAAEFLTISIKTGVRPDSQKSSDLPLRLVSDLKTGVRPDRVRRTSSAE